MHGLYTKKLISYILVIFAEKNGAIIIHLRICKFTFIMLFQESFVYFFPDLVILKSWLKKNYNFINQSIDKSILIVFLVHKIRVKN